jgi:hypothetical protein
VWWFTAVIPTTQEARIGVLWFEASGAKLVWNLSEKQLKEKGLGSWLSSRAFAWGPEFNPWWEEGGENTHACYRDPLASSHLWKALTSTVTENSCAVYIFFLELASVSPNRAFWPFWKNVISYFSSLLLLPSSFSSFFFCSTGDWTQGLTHARQVLYHYSHPPSPSPLFSEIGSW